MKTMEHSSQYQKHDLGLADYHKVYALQKSLCQSVIDGAQDQLIVCEHFPILTLGRMFNEKNLLLSREQIKEQGVDIVSIDRGGDVTLHAPGQVVLYPIMNLSFQERDLRVYLQHLEQVAIEFLQMFDISSQGSDDQRGVWVGSQKIASIGIGVRKWVTYHGIAINIATDLSLYRLIRPCGLDVAMTSLSCLTCQSLTVDEIKDKLVQSFEKVFSKTFV